jgi:hypothetical protein
LSDEGRNKVVVVCYMFWMVAIVNRNCLWWQKWTDHTFLRLLKISMKYLGVVIKQAKKHVKRLPKHNKNYNLIKKNCGANLMSC